MSIAISDLKLPADKIAQIEKSLGGDPTDVTAPNLQEVCDEAASDVARLITGYVLDPTSIENFTRAIALQRAYSYIGTVPKDIEKNYTAAWQELTDISLGKRPNLQKVDSVLSGRAGTWGSGQAIPGRMPNQFPDQKAPAPFVPPNDPSLGTL